jgi:hypothetical protein
MIILIICQYIIIIYILYFFIIIFYIPDPDLPLQSGHADAMQLNAAYAEMSSEQDKTNFFVLRGRWHHQRNMVK